MTIVGEITIAQEKNRLNTPDISKTIQSLNLKIGSLQKMSRENVLKLDGNFIFTRTSSEIHVSENKDGSLTFIARQNQSMHWVVVKDGNLYDDGVKSGQANTEHPSFPNSEYADSYWVIRLK